MSLRTRRNGHVRRGDVPLELYTKSAKNMAEAGTCSPAKHAKSAAVMGTIRSVYATCQPEGRMSSPSAGARRRATGEGTGLRGTCARGAMLSSKGVQRRCEVTQARTTRRQPRRPTSPSQACLVQARAATRCREGRRAVPSGRLRCVRDCRARGGGCRCRARSSPPQKAIPVCATCGAVRQLEPAAPRATTHEEVFKKRLFRGVRVCDPAPGEYAVVDHRPANQPSSSPLVRTIGNPTHQYPEGP